MCRYRFGFINAMAWGKTKKNGDKRLNDLKEQIKNSLATNAHEDFHESVGTYT